MILDYSNHFKDSSKNSIPLLSAKIANNELKSVFEELEKPSEELISMRAEHHVFID